MANERCPSCGAAVRADDPWCTLCWADLRPPPPPPVAPAPVVSAPILAAPVSAPSGAVATADPLTAPLAVVLGDAPAAEAAEAATWPCVECGSANVLDADACSVCAAPFGGRIARLDDPKGERRKLMMYGLAFVGALLLIMGLLTFAMTKVPDDAGAPSVDQKIDWSSIPRE